MIVGPGRHADKQRVRQPDILMSVVNKSRDYHEIAAEIAAVDFVNHSESRRVPAAVVQHYLYLPMANEDPVVVQVMRVPSLDFAGTNGAAG